MLTSPSTYDRIYVRTDKQCLFALDCGSTFYVDRDPLLSQTYLSIHLNNRLIYFHDYIAKLTVVECPIGMAIYSSHIKQIEDMNEETEFDERCQMLVGWLYDLAGQMDVYDGEYVGQPLYIKGQHILDIIEKAGYSDFYSCSLEEYLGMPFDPERLYFVPPHFVKDEILDLSRSGIDRIVEWNSPVDICNVFTERDRATGSSSLCVIGGDLEQSLDMAGFKREFFIDSNKKYYIPANLTIDGQLKSLICDDISDLVAFNEKNTNHCAPF
jgi:hypothetical protein